MSSKATHRIPLAPTEGACASHLERASECRVFPFALRLWQGGPCGRRSRSHNARANGAVVDAPPSAWQAVKRNRVWLVASSLRQVKRSLCMACVGLVWRWRDASRRACALACVRWRSLRTYASCARRLHVRTYPCASNFLRIMRA